MTSLSKTMMAAALALAPLAAGAATVNQAAWTAAGCLGSSTCSIGGLTLSAGRDSGASGTATFGEQTFRGATGLGVRSAGEGSANNRFELQGPRGTAFPGETVTISSATPFSVSSVSLLFLYNPSTFGGDPEEIAFIDGFLGGVSVGGFTLQTIDNAPSFTFSGASSVVRNAPFSGGNDQGSFLISGLFGGKLVDEIVFRAGSVTSGDTHDYAIGAVEVAPIPLPAAVWMLVAGLGGLGLAGRRRAAA